MDSEKPDHLEPPFKVKGSGTRYNMTDNRAVSLFTGENDEVLLVFTNRAGVNTPVRMSKEGARVAAYALWVWAKEMDKKHEQENKD